MTLLGIYQHDGLSGVGYPALMWSVLLTAALAASPDSVIEDGVVIGTVELAVPVDEMVRRIGDPTWVVTVDGGNTSAALVSTDGPCLVADYVVVSTLATARFRVRQCRSAEGFTGELVSSDMFERYHTRWVVDGDSTRSRLRYEVDTVTRLPLPAFIIRAATRGSVRKLMEGLDAWGATWTPSP